MEPLSTCEKNFVSSYKEWKSSSKRSEPRSPCLPHKELSMADPPSTQVAILIQQHKLTADSLREQVSNLSRTCDGLRSNINALESRVLASDTALNLYRQVFGTPHNVKETLKKIALLFATKYPNEEAPEVLELMSWFLKPVEAKFEGEQNDTAIPNR